MNSEIYDVLEKAFQHINNADVDNFCDKTIELIKSLDSCELKGFLIGFFNYNVIDALINGDISIYEAKHIILQSVEDYTY